VAESTLSISFDDLKAKVGHFIGYGSNGDNWTESQADEIIQHVQSGVRQFYYPPAAEGIEAGYDWSFLQPTTTITTIGTYDTGTLEVASGTCTLTGGTWPSWAASGTLTIDSTVYSITSRDSDTVLTVVGDDVAAGESDWSLKHSGIQDLPDDVGRVMGDFFYEPDVYNRSIVLVSEARLQSYLQQSADTDKPQYAAVRYKSDSPTATVGQRMEVLWWPIPSSAYTLTYRYEAYTGELSNDVKYPLGGMRYSELVLESCLAIAEQRENDERGIHWDSFLRLLRAGIEYDRKQGARYFGHMGSEYDSTLTREQCQSSYDITYKGETW
jgi:hypothetical protein